MPVISQNAIAIGTHASPRSSAPFPTGFGRVAHPAMNEDLRARVLVEDVALDVLSLLALAQARYWPCWDCPDRA